MKIIKARNHSIAAGRDVNIHVTVSNGKIDTEKLLCDIQALTGMETKDLFQELNIDTLNGISTNNLQKLLQKILFSQSLLKDFENGKFLEFANTLNQVSTSTKELSSLAKHLHHYLGENEFKKAFDTIKKMLSHSALPKKYKKQLVFEYFQTGYLYFANSGDRDGISSLYDCAHNEFSDDVLSPEIYCLLAEMQQEIATRKTDTSLLLENLASLEALKKICTPSSQAYEHYGLLVGLCLRRIGERGNVTYLNRSLEHHRTILSQKKSRPIEFTNSYANILIRHFEALGTEENLDEAIEVLNKICEPENDVQLSEYNAYPKTLNALGNAYKQKITISGKGEHYVLSIDAYTKAEKYWTETTAPYEWAMLQKNKADATLQYAKKVKLDTEIINAAIANAKKSIKYRNKEQAHHQYERSMYVLKELEKIVAK